MIAGDKAAFRRMRNRRRMYVAICAASCLAMLWGFIHMALAAPLYALVVMTGACLIALVRVDISLGYGRRPE